MSDQLPVPGARFSTVVVSDLAEEALALAVAARGEPLVPVLDAEGLPGRLERFWRGLGIAFEERHVGELERVTAGARKPQLSGIPHLLLASPQVELQQRALAAALARKPVMDLADCSTLLQEGSAAPSVLVLVDTEDVRTELTLQIEGLARVGCNFGIVLVDPGARGRFAIIKALTAGVLRAEHGARFVGVNYAKAADGAPQSIVSASEDMPDTLKRPWDLYVFQGHAQMWDAQASDRLILCAREGRARSNGELAVLPCYHTGECMRQGVFGREAHSRTGLVSVDEIQARVLVLSGCTQLRLGKALESLRSGLVYQACQTDAVAVVASVDYTRPSLGVDALLGGMLAEGQPLGAVVKAVNAVRNDQSDWPGRLGPFVLFGNPCLRFENLQIRDAQVISASEQVLCLDASSELAREPDGVRLRVPLKDGFRRYLTFSEKPPGWWLEGAFSPQGIGYLWLKASPSTSSADWPLRLVATKENPFEPLRRACTQMAKALREWMPRLHEYRCSVKGAGAPELFGACMGKVLGGMERLAVVCASMRLAPGVVVSAEPRQLLAQHSSAYIEQLNGDLFRCVLEAVRLHSLRRVLERRSREAYENTADLVGMCDCREGRVWRRTFSVGAGDEPSRIERLCEACEALDVDDGRALARVLPVQQVKRGQELNVTASFAAPPNELLHLVQVALLRHGLAPPGAPIHWGEHRAAKVQAGQTLKVENRVSVPNDLPHGLHNVAVLAIINGSLFVARRWVEVM